MNVSSLTSSSSSTSSASSSYGSSGLSGLMSGMDTETMVKEMLSGTQTKIDTQKQKKQQLEWKQETYRDCITTINGLYNTYFDTSFDADTTSNLASSKFFSQMASTSSASNVKIVSTDSTASAGDMAVTVKQLATSAVLTSTQEMSGDRKLTGKTLSADMLKSIRKTVTLSVGEDKVTVDLNQADTADKVAAAFNSALADHGVTASVADGRLSLTSESGANVSVDTENSTTYGLSASGLSVADSSVTDAGTVLKGRELEPTAGAALQLSFDGVTKTITLSSLQESIDGNGEKTFTAEDLAASLQKEVRSAFGEYVSVGLSDNQALQFTITADDGSRGHELKVYGSDNTPLAATFGITPGASSSISTSSKLSDIPGISGDSFSFSINGQDFTFSADNTLSTVINTINSSKAGVKLSYSSLSDTFAMASTSTGKQYTIDIEQTEGNLLTAMFGSSVSEGASVASKALTESVIAGTALPDENTFDAAALKMKVNGTTYTFAVDSTDSHTGSDIETALNSWLSGNFGDAVTYENGSLKIADGYSVSIEKTDDGVTDLAETFGFAGKNNTDVSSDAKISDITQLAGADFTLKSDYTGDAADATLADIAQIDGVDVSFRDGRLVLDKDALGGGAAETLNLQDKATLKALFGNGMDSITLSNGASEKIYGTDAQVTINGVDISRSSNTFTVEGITMQVSALSTNYGTEENPQYEKTSITTNQNIDSIVTALKAFVSDYNAVVDKFQGLLNEDAEYQDYAPLTDEQESEMSDSEIEKWTKKAQTGLLRNDDELTGFLSNMRNVLYTKSSSSTVALYNIGIETYDKTGKLSIDETALRKALASDPEGIANLFTDSTDGLAKKMMNVMESSAKLSTGSAGTLVKLAGSKNLSTSLTNNTIYQQLNTIDDRIDQLQDRYDNEKDRYWSMFDAMETAMSTYNTQMTLLNSYFSS